MQQLPPKDERALALSPHILSTYYTNKNKLYNILKNKYKIELKISYSKTKPIMLKEIKRYFNPNKIQSYDGNIPYYFIQEYLQWIKDNNMPSIYAELIQPTNLLINKIELKESIELLLPSGKIYHLNNGSKIMRFLQTIAKEYKFNIDNFKAFKLVHSLIVNDQEKTERIVVSIHPADFLEFFKELNELTEYASLCNRNTFIIYNKKKTWADLYFLSENNTIANLTQHNPDATRPIKEQMRLKVVGNH